MRDLAPRQGSIHTSRLHPLHSSLLFTPHCPYEAHVSFVSPHPRQIRSCRPPHRRLPRAAPSATSRPTPSPTHRKRLSSPRSTAPLLAPPRISSCSTASASPSPRKSSRTRPRPAPRQRPPTRGPGHRPGGRMVEIRSRPRASALLDRPHHTPPRTSPRRPRRTDLPSPLTALADHPYHSSH